MKKRNSGSKRLLAAILAAGLILTGIPSEVFAGEIPASGFDDISVITDDGSTGMEDRLTGDNLNTEAGEPVDTDGQAVDDSGIFGTDEDLTAGEDLTEEDDFATEDVLAAEEDLTEEDDLAAEDDLIAEEDAVGTDAHNLGAYGGIAAETDTLGKDGDGNDMLSEKTVTGLGAGTIADPGIPGSAGSVWNGSYVWYGKHKNESGNPVDAKYRVLDANAREYGGRTMLLDSDEIITPRPINETVTPVTWEESDLREELNRDYVVDDNGNRNLWPDAPLTLNTMEYKAVSISKISAEALDPSIPVPSYDGTPYYTHSTALYGDRFFILDYKEAMNPEYGYWNGYGSMTNPVVSRQKKRVYLDKKEGEYWLRSAVSGNNAEYAVVWGKGAIDEPASVNTDPETNPGISPAFNVDLSRVVFSTKTSTNKPEYKLTLLDDETVITVESAVREENAFTIKAHVDAHPRISEDRRPSQISAVVTDGTWTAKGWSDGAELLQYAVLYTNSESGSFSGTGTLTLDGSIAGEPGRDYHIYLLAEDVNGGHDSDYASRPVELSLHTHKFTVSAKDNTLILTCSEKSCPLQRSRMTAKLLPPVCDYYGDGGTTEKGFAATLDCEDYLTFLSLVKADRPEETVKVMYSGRNGTDYEEEDTPPIEPGYYTASLTIGKSRVSVNYRIKKAPLVVRAKPIELTYDTDLNKDSIELLYEGFVKGENESLINNDNLDFTTDYHTGADVGTYHIRPKGLTDNCYSFIYRDSVLTVKKDDPGITQEPSEISDLKYTGAPQKLISGGKAEGGHFWYALTKYDYSAEAPEFDAGRNGVYSTSVPKATDAGDYSIWYLVKGDRNHTDSDVSGINVTIGKTPIEFTNREIIRNYPRGTEIDELIDLNDYLPDGIDPDNIYFGHPITAAAAGFFKAQPSLTDDGILTYTVSDEASAGSAGTLEVSVYDDSTVSGQYMFTFYLSMSISNFALSEATDDAYTPVRSKTLVNGLSTRLFMTDEAGERVDDQKIIWTSENPAIASVSQDGKITARGTGHTIIGAKRELSDSVEAECEIVVTDATSKITDFKYDYDIGVGDQDLILCPIQSPATASGEFQWSTSDKNAVILVSGTDRHEVPGTTGTDGKSITYDEPLSDVYVLGVGKTAKGKKVKVTATAMDGTGKKITYRFRVGNPVDGFIITPKWKSGAAGSIKVGESLTAELSWVGDEPLSKVINWAVPPQGPGETDVALITSAKTKKCVVKGNRPGTFKIVADHDQKAGYQQSTEDITVYLPVRKVSLNMTSATLSTSTGGKTVHLWANLVAADGSKGNSKGSGVTEDGCAHIAGSNATGSEGPGSLPKVKFAVPDEYASLIDVTSDGHVLAKPAAEGVTYPATAYVEAYVTAYNYSNETKPLRCRITVQEQNPLKSVSLPKKLTIGLDDPVTIEASPLPLNYDDVSTEYRWSVSDKDSKKLGISYDRTTNKATLIGMQNGTAAVTVNLIGKSAGDIVFSAKATCKVTIKPSVKKVVLKNASTLQKNGLAIGKTFKLKTALKLSGKGKAASSALIFESSDPSIAVVSKKGVITAKTPGKTVTITATPVCALGGNADTAAASVTFRTYASPKYILMETDLLNLGTRGTARIGTVRIRDYEPSEGWTPAIKWTVDKKSKCVRLGTVKKDETEKDASFMGGPGEGVIIRGDDSLAVMGVTPGVVNLTGVTVDGSKKKVHCKVTIRGEVTGLRLKTAKGKNGVNNITLADDEETIGVVEYTGVMKAGASLSLKPQIAINNLSSSKKAYRNYKKYTDTSLSYASSDPAAASVNGKGKITISPAAESGSEVTITVSSADGRSRASYRITVK